ncbi:hypothetical protein CR51_36005 [Caballeronia megalochromosomata]|nr:hypothetical protein CR51_36005 [Caballeronia megalochromosomata]
MERQRMKIKMTQLDPVSLWITYADGSLRVRYFNKQEPLNAWWSTALSLKALGVAKMCSVFPVSDLPANCTWTTI